MSPES